MNAATLPPESRSPGTTRANRLLLLLLGLILLAAGTAGLLAGLGAFGSGRADQPVLAAQVSRWADRNTAWFWPAVATLAVLVGVLALRWLVIQVRSNRLTDLDLEADRSRGRTRLEAGALTGALTTEIESYRGVAGARAHLSGDSVAPRLSVRVELDGRVDPGEVRRRVETEAIAHARSALSAEDLPTRLELTISRRPAAPPGASASR